MSIINQLRIIYHAARHESFKVLSRNFINYFSKKKSLYNVCKIKTGQFQLEYFYLTPAKLVVKGWVFSQKTSVKSVLIQLNPDSVLTCSIGLKRPDIHFKYRLDTDLVGFEYVGTCSQPGPKLHVKIRFSEGHEEVLTYNTKEVFPRHDQELLERLYSHPFTEEKVRRNAKLEPRVDIVIAFKDGLSYMKPLLKSINEFTAYKKYHLYLVSNNSTDPECMRYVESLSSENSKITLLYYNFPFNYSKILNFAAGQSAGDYILFLNNDMKIKSRGWLAKLVQTLDHPETGIVGPKLLYPDNTIQHIGMILNVGGLIDHAWRHYPNIPGKIYLRSIRKYTAITGACLLTKRSLFNKVAGFDESLPYSLNDVDFCLKIRNEGYQILVIPDVELVHFESMTRGSSDSTVHWDRTNMEIRHFRSKWKSVLAKGDMFYHDALSLKYPDFRLR